MYKKFLALLVVMMMLFATVPAIAAEQPVIYSSTITVTERGGSFDVGFATMNFKKEFLEEERLPVTFNVQIYAEDGVSYIEVKPDTEGFLKKVHIDVDAYKGLLYDKAKGQNIKVNIKKQKLVVEHFSRYAFR